ncbi:hypothetical protein EV363DRAFT_1293425 [Boletus edulis]|nr:hypothetical protein EV363DRAFT_1293425 [Boletus edulis]
MTAMVTAMMCHHHHHHHVTTTSHNNNNNAPSPPPLHPLIIVDNTVPPPSPPPPLYVSNNDNNGIMAPPHSGTTDATETTTMMLCYHPTSQSYINGDNNIGGTMHLQQSTFISMNPGEGQAPQVMTCPRRTVDVNQETGTHTEDITMLPPTFKEIQYTVESPHFYNLKVIQPSDLWRAKIMKFCGSDMSRIAGHDISLSIKYQQFGKFVWIVATSQFNILFFCEVISDKAEHDCSQMLAQSIVIAWAGSFLLWTTSAKNFFMVAIYVHFNIVATCYIVMETGVGSHDRKPVSHHG